MSKKTTKTVKGGGESKKAAPDKPDAARILIEQCKLVRVGVRHLDTIKPNRWNGHRCATEEMVKAIQEQGVLLPLVVRSMAGGMVEVIDGSRRFNGATRAKRLEVPFVEDEMNDQQARTITLLLNLHREDLPPLEEARKVMELLGLYAGNLKEVAAATGMPWTWVKRRSKLGDLAPEVQKALDDPKCMVAKHATAAALELLALYPHDTQREILNSHKQHSWFWERGEQEMRGVLANATHALKLAAWPVDDALLVPKAGACVDCKKRTGAEPGLFDALENAAELKEHDRCLDGACWALKLATHLQRAEDKARREHPGLVKVVTEDLDWNDKLREDKTVLGVHAFEKVKPDAKGAKPALVMQGPGAGKVIHIVPHRESSGSSSGGRDKAKPKTMAEKREGLESRRIALIIVEKLKPELAKSKLPKPGGDPLEALSDPWWLRLVAAWGAQEPQHIMNDEVEVERDGGWADFDKSGKADVTEVRELVWEQLKKPLEQSLGFALPTQLGEDCIENAKRLAWLLGLKWVELLEFAVAQIPEPKSWAKEEHAKDAKK